MMALVMLLAVLFSIQVRVAALPVREARASWLVRLRYEWALLQRKKELEDRAIARRLRGFKVNRWRQVVKFSDEGGMTIRPRLWVKATTPIVTPIKKHKREIALFAISLILACVGLPVAVGAVINSAGSGNWNVGGTWVGGVAPGTGDDAVVKATHTVTVSANQTTGSVQIEAEGILDLADKTLTMDDENAAGYAYDNDGTLTVTTGVLKFTYAGVTLADWAGAAGNPWNVELAGTSALVLNCDTACTIDNNLTITSGHFDTTAANNYALTVAGMTNVSGSLDTNGSAVTLGSGYTADYAIVVQAGGVVSAPTGTWIVGSYSINGTATFTSGTMTVNSRCSGGHSINWSAACTFDDGNGTVTFSTFAGTQTMSSAANTARTLYNVTVNNASRTIQFGNGTGFTLTCANNLVVSAGTMSMEDETGGADRDLVVGGTITVDAAAGNPTLTMQSGNLTVTSYLAVGGSNSGTFTGGSGAHSIGGIYNNGSMTFTSGTMTITSGYTAAEFFRLWVNPAHNNGTIVFDAGSTTRSIKPFNALTLYNVTINDANTTVTQDALNTGTITIANNLTITAGAWSTKTGAGIDYTLTVTGATSITGTLTCNASTISHAGNVTVNAGGTYTATSGTTTLGYTTGVGTLTVNATGTFTHSNGTVVIAGMNNDYRICPGGSGVGHRFYNLNCTRYYSIVSGSDLYVANNLTIAMVPTQSGGLCSYSGEYRTLTVTGNLTLETSSWNVLGHGGLATYNFGAINVTGNATLSAGIIYLQYASETLTVTGNFVQSSGAFYGYAATVSVGSLAISGGTFSATSGTTTITSRDGGLRAIYFTGGTFTHNSGTVATTMAGGTDNYYNAQPFYNLTVGNNPHNMQSALTVANNLTINGSGLNTTAAGNFALTVAVTTTINSGSTMTCNASTCSFGSGVTTPPNNYTLIINGGGIFAGGSGTHTIGSFCMVGGTCTFTSGTTTINATTPANGSLSFTLTGAAVFSHANGTITFTYAGNQYFYSGSNTAQTFYNLTVNKSSGTLQYFNQFGFAITVVNDLTITAGTFSTAETVSDTSRNLTVTNQCTVSGTLTCNASTCSFGTNQVYGLQVSGAGAVFNGGSGAHSASAVYIASGSATLTSGNMTISYNSSAVFSYGLYVANGATFAHGSGTVIFTYAGTQCLGKDGAGTLALYNLTVNKASGIVNWRTGYDIALTVAGALTVTSGEFSTADVTSGTHNLTVTGAVTVAGTLTGNASAISMGWLVLTGTYSATSATTTITSESGTGYAWDDDGTFTHNSGTVTFTYAGTTLMDATGSFYNLTLNNANLVLTQDTNMTVAGALTITLGQLTTSGSNYSLTVTGAASITGTLTGNASTLDFNSTVTINSGGTLTATSGTMTVAGSLNNSGTFTHSSGTVTLDGGDASVNDTGTAAFTFHILIVNSSGIKSLPKSLTVRSALTVTAGTCRLNATAAAVTLTMGTTAAKGEINATGTLDFTGNATYAITIAAASSAFPCEVDGTPDWDGGGALSKVTITDLILQDAQTIGTATVTVTATRIEFNAALTVTNATLNGTMCTIDASTTTVSSGLYVEGWFDPTDTARGGYDWILVGGAYTISADKTYLTRRNFYKLAGATLTVAAGVTLTIVDATVDGTFVTALAQLVDSNLGTTDIYYTVDLHIQDVAGTAIASAAITIKDKDGNTRASATTDSNGDIDAISPAYLLTLGSTPTIYYPHNLIVSKSGYGSIDYDLTISSPMNMVLVMTGAPAAATGVLAWAKETVTLYPFSANNDSAEPSWGTGVSVLARVVRKRVRLPSPTGQEVYSTAQLYVAGSTTVTVRDKVVLPDTNVAYVLAFQPVIDAQGTTIAKVIYL